MTKKEKHGTTGADRAATRPELKKWHPRPDVPFGRTPQGRRLVARVKDFFRAASQGRAS
jgi:hypothetical protein